MVPKIAVIPAIAAAAPMFWAAIGPAIERISNAEAKPFNSIVSAIDVGIKGSGFGKNDIADSIAPKMTVIPAMAAAAPMV